MPNKLRAPNGKEITHVVSTIRVIEPISNLQRGAYPGMVGAGQFDFDVIGENHQDWDHQSYIRDGGNPQYVFLDEDGSEALGCELVDVTPPPAAAPDPADLREKVMRQVKARIDGIYDDPDLMEFGPLSTDTAADVIAIVKQLTPETA